MLSIFLRMFAHNASEKNGYHTFGYNFSMNCSVSIVVFAINLGFVYIK